MMNKRVPLFICVVLATILVAIGIGWAKITHDKGRLVWRPSAGPQIGAAEDERTLREKARQSRKFTKTENPPASLASASLDDLAGAADVIIIGTAKSNISKLSPDEKRITLEYEMVAEKVYKGTLREGDVFTVSLPGGQVMFPDGSTAAVSVPWFRKMQDGKAYLLFLKQEGEHSFTTVEGPHGLFQIPTDMTSRNVQAHTMIANDPILKYNNMPVMAFLREVRQAVTKDKVANQQSK
jgi:hypothetical protein